MAITDYDAPRMPAVEEDSLEELRARRNTPDSAKVDVDEAELADTYDLPGADQLDEELSVPVVAQQADEFRCTSCFLVRHRNQRAYPDRDVCRECA
jgi:hypothetical protein